MKKLIIFIGVLFILGCSKDPEIITINKIEEESKEVDATNKILLLKIDYMTNSFEGGKELMLSGPILDTDTIPLSVTYEPPGDFGNISLHYAPTNELIFDGSIIWMGTGNIKYPELFDSVSIFSLDNGVINLPNDSMFQIAYYPLSIGSIPYDSVWNSVRNLKIIKNYLNNKKIGLFLYTPSVGAGDPNTWDWFLIMNK